MMAGVQTIAMEGLTLKPVMAKKGYPMKIKGVNL